MGPAASKLDMAARTGTLRMLDERSCQLERRA
jgi:hypothetical protein